MIQQSALTSIPELEAEDEGRKWVPKKKHEVLKAKYKCLKKLFQIYDASVIGILPEPNAETAEDLKASRRRKRSHRTKTDACSGTNEITSGDNTNSEYENTSVATAMIRDLQIDQSCISTQIDGKIDKYAETIDSSVRSANECNCREKENDYPSLPYLVINEKRKLTRLQCFVSRLFGIRRDTYAMRNEPISATSDTLTYREKRRRRGLRFRKLRKPKKIKSESALRDMKNPVILSYVQSVQKSCLTDMTPRHCPISGCKMIAYGIINYNDHLNLSHFKEKKYICHYCHEGFEKIYDRLDHENEHIGISKLNTNVSSLSTARQTSKMASNTQTDPEAIPNEKLKKIVSFFDKISDPEQMLTDIKKNGCSDSNLRSKMDTSTESEASGKTRTVSCCNMRRKETRLPSSASRSIGSSKQLVSCDYCGENFRYRRQLSLHVDLEHQIHGKFSKFHSCAGIVNRPHVDMTSLDGRINVHSDVQSTTSGTNSFNPLNTSSTVTGGSVCRRKSDESLTCDPSTNIVYYTSTESTRKPSVVDSLVKKVRSYRWEPGTKIIRV